VLLTLQAQQANELTLTRGCEL